MQQLTGKKYYLEVKTTDKVREVKHKVCQELEVKQKVHLMWKNEQMEDCVTLRALGIDDDATVQMVIQPDTNIKLKVKTFKKGMLSVELTDSSTVLDLMTVLSRTTLRTTAKIPDFYFKGLQLSTMSADLPIHSFGICEGATIIQYQKEPFDMQLENARDCKLSLITVRGSNTIKELKENISGSINVDESMITDHEIVVFHSQKDNEGDITATHVYHELDRNDMTLIDSDIRPTDIITFIRYHEWDVYAHVGNISIHIKGEAKHWPQICGVYHNETVLSLRLKIQHQLNIPYEKQVLTVDGNKDPCLSKKISARECNFIALKVIDRPEDSGSGDSE